MNHYQNLAESALSERPSSNTSSPVMVTVPSAQLEETQRELRDLREIVSEMRAASNVNGHTASDSQSVDTGFTPPPEYATGRGSSMPMMQSTVA